MEKDSRPKAGYIAYALVSVVLGVLASALPLGIARGCVLDSSPPLGARLPLRDKKVWGPHGGRRLVAAYAVPFGLFWLLLGAGALGVQIPLGQLYTVWVVLFVALVCVQAARHRGR
jgi:hypothetical protein